MIKWILDDGFYWDFHYNGTYQLHHWVSSKQRLAGYLASAGKGNTQHFDSIEVAKVWVEAEYMLGVGQ